jgi:hypothetical protein
VERCESTVTGQPSCGPYESSCQERKMDCDEEFAKQYVANMEHYFQIGYAVRLTPEEAAISRPRVWYLPQLSVTKPSQPDQLRIVFHAAAMTNGYSLNSFLVKGPNFMQQLPNVIMTLREWAMGFIRDIKEMLRKVRVREEDTPCQRFLWRGRDSEREPDICEMKVMTFRATRSLCLATYIKDLNAEQQQTNFPENWRDIIDNHCVDDYLGALDSVEGAKKKVMDVIEIGICGGFAICNFTSSSKEVLQSISAELMSRVRVTNGGSLGIAVGPVS